MSRVIQVLLLLSLLCLAACSRDAEAPPADEAIQRVFAAGPDLLLSLLLQATRGKDVSGVWQDAPAVAVEGAVQVLSLPGAGAGL